MSLKHLWVISESGLSLFSIKINQRSDGNIIEQTLFDEGDKYCDYMKATAVYAALSFISGCIGPIQDGCFETGNLLWAVYPTPKPTLIKSKPKLNLPEPNRPADYSVISQAQIDPNYPIGVQKTRLLTFCKLIFMDFYAAFGQKIKYSLKRSRFNFKGYKTRCISVMESFKFPNLLQSEEQIIFT